METEIASSQQSVSNPDVTYIASAAQDLEAPLLNHKSFTPPAVESNMIRDHSLIGHKHGSKVDLHGSDELTAPTSSQVHYAGVSQAPWKFARFFPGAYNPKRQLPFKGKTLNTAINLVAGLAIMYAVHFSSSLSFTRVVLISVFFSLRKWCRFYGFDQCVIFSWSNRSSRSEG